MNATQFTFATEKATRGALERSWSGETSVCYNPSIAPISYGQCAPTAVVVFETYGGEVLRTEVKKVGGGSIRRFYNRIEGVRRDFTADQFDIPGYWCELTYADIPSSVEEACTEMLPGQLGAMRQAFQRALSQSDGGPSIERTCQRPLRALWPAAHVKR